MRILILPMLAIGALPVFPQAQSFTQGPHKMEITLELLESGKWKGVNPGLVLAQNDRVRFRFRTNFDGYLYVMNRSTSGKYEQLFPREETGQNNRVTAGQDYTVPATKSVFRISGPPGHETVYWLITPAALSDGGSPKYLPLPPPPPPDKRLPQNMVPRCDDEIFRARGECVDSSAGPQVVEPGSALPRNLAGAGAATPRDLLFMRKENTSVVASPVPLSGPVLYEFRLAHK
ncbi:MAG TPA: DUF4384 domain-containing protein [Bryobacteraceae bacterium]|jgi:hypothetical protein|nr:DUF4384 domain-containing protein [Bryobacteraceae bacterium]